MFNIPVPSSARPLNKNTNDAFLQGNFNVKKNAHKYQWESPSF